jgi:hypothetical protein
LRQLRFREHRHLQDTQHRIETQSREAIASSANHFHPRQPLFSTKPDTRFMKDLGVSWLHMSPEAQEESERKTAQALARFRLNKLRA